METIGARLDLNSFVGEAVGTELGPLFPINVFDQISLIFEKFYLLIYLNNYI